MDILLVARAFTSLPQRLYAELSDHGHLVDVVLASHGADAVRAAVRDACPELIVVPTPDTVLPEDVRCEHTCLVLRPGPPGDRGPTPLDWAIAEDAHDWAVTVLQAEAAPDAGPVWATVPCTLPPVGKSDLERNEVADAAVSAVLLAVRRYAEGSYKPLPQDDPAVRMIWRDAFPQARRRVDWAGDDTRTVLRKLRGGDSRPGVLDEVLGREVYLHGGHREDRLRGEPGDLIAVRAGAVCRATRDGAVWIPELRPRATSGDLAPFRCPATAVLDSLPGVDDPLRRLPEVPARLELAPHRHTWTDIRYRHLGDVGLLTFSFPGGAVSARQCRRLLAAYRYALTRRTSVLVLGGRRDLFCTGMNLNVIEAAADPAGASWANLVALDDLVEAVLRTTDRLVVAAVGGDASSGGALLALAADEVWCRTGGVLAPHSRRLGLCGSGWWTYVLPRRVGADTAERLTREALPVSAASAAGLGLVDRLVPAAPQEFGAEVRRLATDLAAAPDLGQRISAKAEARVRHEAARPLTEYRQAGAARMRETFYDPSARYHALRSAQVRGTPAGPARPLSPAD